MFPVELARCTPHLNTLGKGGSNPELGGSGGGKGRGEVWKVPLNYSISVFNV